jgi:hypothetical protein
MNVISSINGGNMNIRKLSETDLINLINTTTDTTILAAAEDEFVRRETSVRYEITEDDIDENIVREIDKSWRHR